MKPDCLFCKIVNKDVPAVIEYEDDEIIAFRDINPRAKTHILIIPKKHIDSIAKIDNSDQNLIGRLILTARDLAQKEQIHNGFRVVSNTGPDAGQAVLHLHFHLLGGEKLGPIA